MTMTDKIKLQGKAGMLGVEGYRQMTTAQLEAAIKVAEKAGSTPAKGKTEPATNGSKGKTAATAVVKGKTAAVTAPKVSAAPVKGKTTTAKASTSAPAAKSTARKTAATPPAAKGKVERPTTGGKGKMSTASPKPARTPAAPKAGEPVPAKGKTATKPLSTRARAVKAGESFKSTIDNSKIDWKAESTVGLSGKRKDVLDSLRANKGDKGKVFVQLQPQAMEWYPNALNSYPQSPTKKHAAERMLTWLIGKVAFDFVRKTGQHNPGTRIGYRQSTDPRHIKRREAREAAAKARGIKPATGPKKATTPAKGRTTPARKPAAQAPAKKPAARKPATAARGAAAGKGKQTLRGKR